MRSIAATFVVMTLLAATSFRPDIPSAAVRGVVSAQTRQQGATSPARPVQSAREIGGDAGKIRPVPVAVESNLRGLSGELVFQSDLEGPPKIFRIELSTGTVTRLTQNLLWRDEHPRWSPDGTRIVFHSNRHHYDERDPDPRPQHDDLYLMDADGGNVRRLTTGPDDDQTASWSPDGKSIVYTSGKGDGGNLHRLWLEDGRIESITFRFGRTFMPFVSPDGGRVAFAAATLRRDGLLLLRINLLDLTTGQVLGLDSGNACWPAWAPDGSRVGFVNLDQEPSALRALSIGLEATEHIALISDEKIWSYYPDWSPDGRQVAFSVSPAHHEGEDWDLAVMDVENPGTFIRLTAGPGNDRVPDWRPLTNPVDRRVKVEDPR